MKKIIPILILLVFLFISLVSLAQDKQDPVGTTVDWWSRMNLLLNKEPSALTSGEKDEITRFIDFLKLEDKRLDTIVYTITDLDEMSKDFLPQWIVQDEELQMEILNKLILYFGFNPTMINKLKNDFASSKLNIRVIQKPLTEKDVKTALRTKKEPKKQIIGVFLSKEHRIVGADNLKKILGKELIDKLTNAGDYKVKNGYELLYKQPRFASTSLSIYGGDLTLNLLSDTAVIKVGAKFSIGQDILNYPFWYGSEWNVGAFYQPSEEQSYYLGTLIPFRPGQERINLVGPLNLNSRKLNGAYGVTGEFNVRLFNSVPYLDNTLLAICGNFSYNSLNTKGNEILVNGDGTFLNNVWDKDKLDFYYTTGNAHGFAEFTEQDLGIKLALGVGYFQVYNSIIDKDGETIKPIKKYTRSDLFARILYHHHGVTIYNIGLQYFYSSVMVIGEIQLFPFLSIQTKYSRVMGRDVDPWEYKDCFTISPRFLFSF